MSDTHLNYSITGTNVFHFPLQASLNWIFFAMGRICTDMGHITYKTELVRCIAVRKVCDKVMWGD